MKAIVFHPEAEVELEEASDFYEARSEGRGGDFEAAVEAAVDFAARMPSDHRPGHLWLNALAVYLRDFSLGGSSFSTMPRGAGTFGDHPREWS